jgi:methylated-DNA-[protein]-cysteine S-methyltransferase
MIYRYIDSPLGRIQLGEEDGRLAKIHFINDGDDRREATHPANGSSPLLENVQQELEAYFDGRLQQFGFMPALGQPGTAFQQKVWELLTAIPFGKTISYRDLSLKLGDEKVIRAAASANGQNDIAIVVPCHRVIGSDGSLTGYAGGLWRKKWLLEHEARLVGNATQGSLF